MTGLVAGYWILVSPGFAFGYDPASVTGYWLLVALWILVACCKAPACDYTQADQLALPVTNDKC